jgi:hypothetical protein
MFMRIVVLVFAAPVASLLALWLSGAEDWISLYFRRKAAEEKRRIADLDSQRRP